MVDDCLSADERDKYLKGMRDFEAELKFLTRERFSTASAEERLTMLKTLEDRLDDRPEHIRVFYRKSREYIIQGYVSSQHFLTEVKPYQLVPGPNYDGCAPLSAKKPLS